MALLRRKCALFLYATLPHLIAATPVIASNAATLTSNFLARQEGFGTAPNFTQSTPSSTTPTPTPTGANAPKSDGPPFHWYYIIPLAIVGFAFVYILQWLGIWGQPRTPHGTSAEYQEVWTKQAYGQLLTWRRKAPRSGLQRMFPNLAGYSIVKVPWDGDRGNIPPGCWVAGPAGSNSEMKAFWQRYRPIPYVSDNNAGGGG